MHQFAPEQTAANHCRKNREGCNFVFVGISDSCQKICCCSCSCSWSLKICQADNILVGKFVALLLRFLHKEVEHYTLESIVVNRVLIFRACNLGLNFSPIHTQLSAQLPEECGHEITFDLSRSGVGREHFLQKRFRLLPHFELHFNTVETAEVAQTRNKDRSQRKLLYSKPSENLTRSSVWTTKPASLNSAEVTTSGTPVSDSL